MATITSPTTPQSATGVVATPSPGSWQHPRSDEIARRQKANTFNDSNIHRILWNAGALLAIYTASHSHSITTLLRTEFISSIAIPTLWLLISLIIYNLYTALTPLLRPKDELTDIPLTPTQRKLLGLEPTAAPPQTPGTQYITPPRYSHSPTPRLSPATRNNSNYSTPISGSPSFGRERSDSPTGPTSSPLYQKSIGRTREPVRRSSYGSPSPLGPGLGGREGSVMGAPHTPSPTAGRGASVGLNSKWLYNKGRSSSGGRGI